MSTPYLSCFIWGMTSIDIKLAVTALKYAAALLPQIRNGSILRTSSPLDLLLIPTGALHMKHIIDIS